MARPEPSSSPLAIADAGRADLDEVTALERASFPQPWRRDFFESELQADGRFNRIARGGDGRIVGYCFSMHVLDEMHVNKIAVAPAWRRRGVAKALMDDALEFARSRGIASIALEVRESNEGARAFYRTLGFEERYRRPRYYPDGETAVVMATEV